MNKEKMISEHIDKKYYETCSKIAKYHKQVEGKSFWDLVDLVKLCGYLEALIDLQNFIYDINHSSDLK